jgi:hypothetical protein
MECESVVRASSRKPRRRHDFTDSSSDDEDDSGHDSGHHYKPEFIESSSDDEKTVGNIKIKSFASVSNFRCGGMGESMSGDTSVLCGFESGISSGFLPAANKLWHSLGREVPLLTTCETTDPRFLELMDNSVTQHVEHSSPHPHRVCQSDEDSGDDEYPPEWYLKKYGF